MELCKNHPGINDLKYFHILVIKQKNLFILIVKINYGVQFFVKLKYIYLKYVCSSYLKCFKLFEDNNFSFESIPHILDINNFLLQRTGFQLKPVTGLIDLREF